MQPTNSSVPFKQENWKVLSQHHLANKTESMLVTMEMEHMILNTHLKNLVLTILMSLLIVYQFQEVLSSSRLSSLVHEKSKCMVQVGRRMSSGYFLFYSEHDEPIM